MTGSQVLAMCLMDYWVQTPDDPDTWKPLNLEFNRPAKTYIAPVDGILDMPSAGVAAADFDPLSGHCGSIMDTWPTNLPRKSPDKSMPILYFVARPGQAGVSNIYRAQDNLNMGGTYPDAAMLADFHEKITRVVPDSWSGNYDDARTQPYKQDSFILITPGPDREWFTGDDITNFTE